MLSLLVERIGRFEVRGELGKGGMGRVLRAWDPMLDREVAIKLAVARPDLSEEAQRALVARFQREVRVMARLEHAGLARVYEAGAEGQRLYLVMELIEGESLADRLEREEVLATPDALGICAQVARALAHAHKQKVLHRDVKPENIVLARDGRARLIDFGLAKLTAPEEENTLTLAGRVVGTPGYMSPEHVQCKRELVGPPTDVWGLGVTLYRALTGVLPFTGRDPYEVMHQVLKRDPSPPSWLRDDLPAEVEDIIHRCLAKEPADRPATAELARELADLACSVPALPAPRPERSEELEPAGSSSSSGFGLD